MAGGIGNIDRESGANKDEQGSASRMSSMVWESLSKEADSRAFHSKLYPVIKRVFNPVVIGAEKVPSKPVLLVANHALLALDVPLIQSTFMHHTNRLPRAMADELLFSSRTLSKLIIKQGGILGNPDICAAMMDAGKDLLVFPGGSYEVNKPETERYQLKWKERTGFVRLAAMHGYTILPVATIGPDEFYGRYMESEQLYRSVFGRFLKRQGFLGRGERTDVLPPIPKGVFGTPFIKPQRFYMSIGDPIDLSLYKGQHLEHHKLMEIRNKVSRNIEGLIRDLLLFRVQQSGRNSWLRNFLTR